AVPSDGPLQVARARDPLSPRRHPAAGSRARRPSMRGVPRGRARGALGLRRAAGNTETPMSTRTVDAGTATGTVAAPVAPAPAAQSPARAEAAGAAGRTSRIAAIDWMRGLVMVLMVIDHASMAFDMNHLSEDSAMYPETAVEALPPAEFLTRWLTHICAP